MSDEQITPSIQDFNNTQLLYLLPYILWQWGAQGEGDGFACGEQVPKFSCCKFVVTSVTFA